MPPHGPGHGRPHGWMVNDEKERSLADIGERLRKIGELLGQQNLRLGDYEIIPSDPCRFLLRYERKPRGELTLKIELEWLEPPTAQLDEGAGDVDIGSIR